MTSERVAVVGTGLIGTSIALSALAAGDRVGGYDRDAEVLARAAERAPGLVVAPSMEACVEGVDVAFVCTPVRSIAAAVVASLRAAPSAIVSDVGSVKHQVMVEVERLGPPALRSRFVGGHPMSGSERAGPDAASATHLDGAVWVLTPGQATTSETTERLAAWIEGIGARPVVMTAERHDRLVAFVSHLPQAASTALMAVAAAEEAGEPDILLLAAGGFRDLTRLAASSPELWAEILLANARAIGEALDLYVSRLGELRGLIAAGDGEGVRKTFERAKRARLSLAAKPQIRTGVTVLQVPVPDRPGALADLTRTLGEAGVNIEDLQIVHSPEGGGGTVHLTVAAGAGDNAARALTERGFAAVRLA